MTENSLAFERLKRLSIITQRKIANGFLFSTQAVTRDRCSISSISFLVHCGHLLWNLPETQGERFNLLLLLVTQVGSLSEFLCMYSKTNLSKDFWITSSKNRLQLWAKTRWQSHGSWAIKILQKDEMVKWSVVLNSVKSNNRAHYRALLKLRRFHKQAPWDKGLQDTTTKTLQTCKLSTCNVKFQGAHSEKWKPSC